MDTKRADLSPHATEVGNVIANICGISVKSPLIKAVEEADTINLTLCSVPPIKGFSQRVVTTDLGHTERVFGLPIPRPNQPKFWVGIHESWKFSGKRKITFLGCGIRIYAGEANESSRHFLRLEWVAPEIDESGMVYQGKHAGHPHWHIDRSALVGPEEHLRSLESLTTPQSDDQPPEEFDAIQPSRSDGLIQDLSWFMSVHLPAQCHWMHQKWDGLTLPAPHQTAPENLNMLGLWWGGSLRYISAELSAHAIL